jgi:hypothetical protein
MKPHEPKKDRENEGETKDDKKTNKKKEKRQ